MGQFGRWISSGTVGQVDFKWDSWAGGLQMGQLDRQIASGTVRQVDIKWDRWAGGLQVMQSIILCYLTTLSITNVDS